MPKPKSKVRQWWILIAEFFFIIKIYDWISGPSGFDPATYFIIAFILFWFLNYIFFYKWNISRSPASTLTFKYGGRSAFTDDFFGIGVAVAIIFGYGLGKAISNTGIIIFLIIFVIAFAYRLIFSYDNILKRTWGLIIMGFIFGMSLATPITNNIIVIVIFALMHFVMFLSKDPGET